MPCGKPAITSGPIARPRWIDLWIIWPRGSRRQVRPLAGTSRPLTENLRLRAAGAAPAERGDTVGAPEVPREIRRTNIAYPSADLLHRQVRFDQQAACLGHAALGDPLQNGPP